MSKQDFLYSFEISYKEAIDIINRSCNNSNDVSLSKEVHHKLCILIHSMMDLWGRIAPDNNSMLEEEKKIMQAFRFICNELKHNKEYISIHKRISSSTFPFSFPFRFGSNSYIEWKEADIKSNIKFENQRKAYQSMLAGKSVIATLKTAKELIEKYISGNCCDNS